MIAPYIMKAPAVDIQSESVLWRKGGNWNRRHIRLQMKE
jgi:hypothetical protein